MQSAGNDSDLLVADIGGTNSRFAIASGETGEGDLRATGRFANAGVAHFAEQLARYAAGLEAPLPERACIAIAGPTDGEQASLTNGSWQFDRASLAREFCFAEVALINDFTALASGVRRIAPANLERIKHGTAIIDAPRCVIGPGTGLGVACIVGSEDRPEGQDSGQRVIPTEGGHVDLPVATEQEWSLRQWLRQRAGSAVSAEHALCGEGLRGIDAFLRADTGSLRPVAEITREALEDAGGTGRQAVALFLGLLARFAGNAALTQGARGGVFIGGGIVPRLLPIIDCDAFARNFTDKGAMADYCTAIPIDVITDTDAALRGAAIAFHRTARETGR